MKPPKRVDVVTLPKELRLALGCTARPAIPLPGARIHAELLLSTFTYACCFVSSCIINNDCLLQLALQY